MAHVQCSSILNTAVLLLLVASASGQLTKAKQRVDGEATGNATAAREATDRQGRTNTYEQADCDLPLDAWLADIDDSCRDKLRASCEADGGQVCYVPKNVCDASSMVLEAFDFTAPAATYFEDTCEYVLDWEFCAGDCLPAVDVIADVFDKLGIENDCKGQSVADQLCKVVDSVGQVADDCASDPLACVDGILG